MSDENNSDMGSPFGDFEGLPLDGISTRSQSPNPFANPEEFEDLFTRPKRRPTPSPPVSPRSHSPVRQRATSSSEDVPPEFVEGNEDTNGGDTAEAVAPECESTPSKVTNQDKTRLAQIAKRNPVPGSLDDEEESTDLDLEGGSDPVEKADTATNDTTTKTSPKSKRSGNPPVKIRLIINASSKGATVKPSNPKYSAAPKKGDTTNKNPPKVESSDAGPKKARPAANSAIKTTPKNSINETAPSPKKRKAALTPFEPQPKSTYANKGNTSKVESKPKKAALPAKKRDSQQIIWGSDSDSVDDGSMPEHMKAYYDRIEGNAERESPFVEPLATGVAVAKGVAVKKSSRGPLKAASRITKRKYCEMVFDEAGSHKKAKLNPDKEGGEISESEEDVGPVVGTNGDDKTSEKEEGELSESEEETGNVLGSIEKKRQPSQASHITPSDQTEEAAHHERKAALKQLANKKKRKAKTYADESDSDDDEDSEHEVHETKRARTHAPEPVAKDRRPLDPKQVVPPKQKQGASTKNKQAASSIAASTKRVAASKRPASRPAPLPAPPSAPASKAPLPRYITRKPERGRWVSEGVRSYKPPTQPSRTRYPRRPTPEYEKPGRVAERLAYERSHRGELEE